MSCNFPICFIMVHFDLVGGFSHSFFTLPIQGIYSPCMKAGNPRAVPSIHKLKTTPTPNKDGSYDIKGGFVFGVRMPYFL